VPHCSALTDLLAGLTAVFLLLLHIDASLLHQLGDGGLKVVNSVAHFINYSAHNHTTEIGKAREDPYNDTQLQLTSTNN
jgi:hypothetical protein